MSFVLNTVMDAIAQELVNDGVATRVYAWPPDSIVAPCAIVGYPTKLDYDMTAHAWVTTGKVEAEFPVWFVVGKVLDKSTRDGLSAVVSGAPGIKESLDGNLAGAVDYLNVNNVSVEPVTVADVDYMAARFDCEVVA